MTGTDAVDAIVDACPRGACLLVGGASRSAVTTVPGALADAAADGGVLVTTRDGAFDISRGTDTLVDRFDRDRIGVVDCTPGDEPGASDDLTWQVSSPVDFTGIGIAASRCFDALERRGVEAPWLVFDSLSTPLVSADSATVVKFAHTMMTHVADRGGLGVFTVHTNTTTGIPLERLKHLADGMLEVRTRDGRRRVRSRGLPDVGTEWVPVGSTERVEAELSVS